MGLFRKSKAEKTAEKPAELVIGADGRYVVTEAQRAEYARLRAAGMDAVPARKAAMQVKK